MVRYKTHFIRVRHLKGEVSAEAGGVVGIVGLVLLVSIIAGACLLMRIPNAGFQSTHDEAQEARSGRQEASRRAA